MAKQVKQDQSLFSEEPIHNDSNLFSDQPIQSITQATPLPQNQGPQIGPGQIFTPTPLQRPNQPRNLQEMLKNAAATGVSPVAQAAIATPGLGSMIGMGIGAALVPEVSVPTLATMGLAALAAGTGAAAGEGYQQLAQRAAGQKPWDDETLGPLKKVAIAGLHGAAIEAGFRTLGAAGEISGITPAIKRFSSRVVGSLMGKSPLAIQWAFKNSSNIPIGQNAVADSEKIAMDGLVGAQKAVWDGMQKVSDDVGSALADLERNTGGRKIFDLGALSNKYKTLLSRLDPTERLTWGNDLGKIERLLDSMSQQPSKKIARGLPSQYQTIVPGENLGLKSAMEVNGIKKGLQNMVDYSKRGVSQMESDPGEQMIKSIARDIRQQIQRTSDAFGYSALSAANAVAESTHRLYDEVGEYLSTRNVTSKKLIAKVDQLAGEYFKDGQHRINIEAIGQKFPGAAKHIEKMLGGIKARNIVQDVSPKDAGLMRALFSEVGKSAAIPAVKMAQKLPFGVTARMATMQGATTALGKQDDAGQ